MIEKVLKGKEVEIEAYIQHKNGHSIPYLLKSLGYKSNNKQYQRQQHQHDTAIDTR